MDSNHRLDAPDEEHLQSIEQVGDRSDLSSLYPQAKPQWTGDIVSKEERDSRLAAQQDTLSFGIRTYFLTIGLLIPLPFIVITVLVTAALVYIKPDTVPMFVVPGIIAFFLVAGIVIASFKKLSTLFYMNALRALPYSTMVLGMLAIIVFMLYHATSFLHGYQLLPAVSIVSAMTIVVSIFLNYFLLVLWTTPVINGAFKVLIMVTLALALLAAGVYFSVF
jgi:hypothetical protein